MRFRSERVNLPKCAAGHENGNHRCMTNSEHAWNRACKCHCTVFHIHTFMRYIAQYANRVIIQRYSAPLPWFCFRCRYDTSLRDRSTCFHSKDNISVFRAPVSSANETTFLIQSFARLFISAIAWCLSNHRTLTFGSRDLSVWTCPIGHPIFWASEMSQGSVWNVKLQELAEHGAWTAGSRRAGRRLRAMKQSRAGWSPARLFVCITMTH